MSTAIAEPPALSGTDFLEESNLADKLHVYLSYEYLPLRNITTLIKNVNELYELMYVLIEDEKIPKQFTLCLDYVATGNSIDWISKILDVAKPSRKAAIALLITAAVIYTPFGIEQYRSSVVGRHKTEAEIEKTKAETRKTLAEEESIALENLIKRSKISQDSISRIVTEKNRKKILRKRRAIIKSASDRPINKCIINNIVIFDRTNLNF